MCCFSKSFVGEVYQVAFYIKSASRFCTEKGVVRKQDIRIEERNVKIPVTTRRTVNTSSMEEWEQGHIVRRKVKESNKKYKTKMGGDKNVGKIKNNKTQIQQHLFLNKIARNNVI